MHLAERIIGFVAPLDCLGCERQDRVLCGPCSEALPQVPSRCFNCRAATENFQACKACQRHWRLEAVLVVTAYKGVAKTLIRALKFHSARMAAHEIALMMQRSFPLQGDEDLLIVPVPSSTSRYRQRSYDQACLIARDLARLTRLPYRNCLRRLGKHHQIGASRQQRLQQMTGSFLVTSRLNLVNRDVLLVDDVVTTGATLEAAARTCLAAGARSVQAIVFAQP